ncbi:hypothetical protein [Pontibacter akesuensis]|uniref:Uncharacterized protein n=1 Tax=Pontibacter akesuensis TaxID=388950 RepID=A0A1I7KY20_9BACT|nr:hypothetical protein [Pontibacter akesuensis]GHA78140.1 hypothetical protein GCM10007389_35090 [Pontibacter akesuensis]SFV02327.1 hypothetical protein SAMN04487941_0098 [Pontibacter akesuensis]
MDLIVFCWRARIRSFFGERHLKNVLLLILGVLAAGGYSWLFTYLLNLAHENKFASGTDEVLAYSNLFLLAIIILKGFFPAYVPKANLINQIYPLSALQRFRAELLVELVSPFYFVALNFLVLLFLSSPHYTVLHLLQSILVLLTAHVTLRSLQVLVERRTRWRSANFYSAAVMAAAFIALQARMPMFKATSDWLMLVVHMAALGFFLGANFLLELAAAEPRRKIVEHSTDARRSINWRLLRNHKLVKQMLLFGLAFKVILLGLDAFAYTSKGQHVLDEIATLWLFAGPIIVYSYVFNNLWGFYRNLWLTIERSSNKAKDLVRVTLQLLRLPLLLDAAVTFAYIAFFNHENALFAVVMYVGAILLLTPLSIVASIVSPKTVKGGLFSFSSKTSTLFNFLSIGLFGMLFLPLLHPILYLVYPVLIAGAMLAMVAVLKEYPKYKYKLHETHFKAA